MSVFSKFDYVRSDKLMKAYRQIPCQNCGADDGTVCGAHSNEGRHGKGRSIKASDVYCASLCARCHSSVDQGKSSKAQRQAIWWNAHVETIRELTERGLWPANVPIPSTDKLL